MNDREWNQKLKEAAERSAEKLADCSAFISLFSEKMAEEPVPVLQLGLAMLMDKPIYLLVPEGAALPENLRKVAVRIEYYKRDAEDMTSFRQASDRLLKDWGEG
jgi:hypothetical protein